MNKIQNINLGGYPFTIDEDVYLGLQSYLDTIENHFGKSEGVCDIMSDIEARMAELFTDSLGERQIINQDDLKNVINIMGTPEQFGADTEDHSTDFKKQNKQTIQTGKKFFRDPEDKVLGGVCSGIAAYWGFKDAFWVRLVFGILLFSGIGPIPYIIVWIIAPSARTAGDRLAMRGEEANVENIGRMIDDEFSDMSESLAQLKDDFFSKKKSDRQKNNLLNKASAFIGFLVNAFLRISNRFIRILLSLFGLRKI